MATVPARRVLRGVMTTDWLADHRAWTRWGSLLLPIVVGAALGLFRDGMNQSTAAMVLVLTGRRGRRHGRPGRRHHRRPRRPPGAFDFFLTEPYYSLSIHHQDDLELAVALVVVGLAVTEIALWGRRQQAAAQRRDGLHLRSDPPARPAAGHDRARPGRRHRDRDHARCSAPTGARGTPATPAGTTPSSARTAR